MTARFRQFAQCLRLSSFFLRLVLCSLALVTAARAADKTDKTDFQPLFNGKDFTGWVVEGAKTSGKDNDKAKDKDKGKDSDKARDKSKAKGKGKDKVKVKVSGKDQDKKPIWTVEDKMIVASGKGYGFLRYDREVKDFLFEVEYRLSKRGNSGIGIRTVKFTGPAATRPSFAAYEVQILDDAGKTPTAHTSGSLYRYVAAKENATLPAGQWNKMRIECRGPKILVTLNGKTLHDLDQTTIAEIKDKPLAGYISLQSHSNRVEFRNPRLKTL